MELTAVTTPVTSSTKSSCPEVRLLAVEGRALALRTFVAARLTAVTTCGWEALTVSALPKLKLIASSWSPPVWMKKDEKFVSFSELKGPVGGEYYQILADYYLK